MHKLLLLLSLLILVSGSFSCAAQDTSVTPQKTETTTVAETKTVTATATNTQTQSETVTITVTQTETQTVTVTETVTPIRVKRATHGSGQIVTLDMENEYLPVVVACENYAAPYESLKAQAIASRTFAFYKILHEPRSDDYDILDSESDQVYNPAVFEALSHSDQERIRQAVRETREVVIRYAGVIICSSYVSGTSQTLHYVTFNEGKSGDNITQTTLNWTTVPPSKYPYNRGCMGQIQANELAEQGYNYEQILKYFYGSDISIEKYRTHS
jgi:peptidoglycan hydrolase-like amidase